jgi:formylglycine-generating enzyme required for sulfatase activity
MASLAQLSELVGFFSYSREDDEAFRGSLSALRDAIQRELGAQLGRTKRNFRLWQDQEAIAPGKDWKAEIARAVEQSVFFIPIVTPRAVSSDYSQFEFASFVARESALGRGDLVFPILWISVPALMDETEWRDDPVLSVVAKRQYVDWRPYRRKAVDSPDFGQEIERFCGKIIETLREPSLSTEERRELEADAKRRADAEHQHEIPAAKNRAEEYERARQEAEVGKRFEAIAKGQREEAETQSRLGEESQRDERTRAKVVARPVVAGELESRRQSRQWPPSRRQVAIVGTSVAAMAAGAAAWWNQHQPVKEPVKEIYQPAPYKITTIGKKPAREKEASYVTPLPAEWERALEQGSSFLECSYCPEMIVVPAGRFMMGTLVGQGFPGEEGPRHEVTIAKAFAVAKFALTFDEWDTCAARGDCRPDVGDNGWGRGRQSAINVSWDDAQTYVKWLSKIIGKPYRLLSESEYEYAARAGSETKYPWGDEIKLNGKPMANCYGCDSQWDNKQTAPVGSFPANDFGLYDMVGNVKEWTEDCWNASYRGAPADGSPWTDGNCGRRVVRGGAWDDYPVDLRSADRSGGVTDGRYNNIGFRVARTLNPYTKGHSE